MNKLTKVGFSALCGSLAAISTANAGDLTATGGIDLTWVSSGEDTTGNPVGMGSNIPLKVQQNLITDGQLITRLRKLTLTHIQLRM